MTPDDIKAMRERAAAALRRAALADREPDEPFPTEYVELITDDVGTALDRVEALAAEVERMAAVVDASRERLRTLRDMRCDEVEDGETQVAWERAVDACNMEGSGG